MYLSASRRRATVDPAVFPWCLPQFAGLDELSFTTSVTFLVGENGSGRSTLLEGLAAGMSAVAVGSHDVSRDPTLGAARTLAGAYRFVRRNHPTVKLFFRAEDAFGFTQRVQRDMTELATLQEDFRRRLPEGSYGQKRAMGMIAGQRRALATRYGEDPDAHSHRMAKPSSGSCRAG